MRTKNDKDSEKEDWEAWHGVAQRQKERKKT